jgi:hypothetical protein
MKNHSILYFVTLNRIKYKFYKVFLNRFQELKFSLILNDYNIII